MAGPPSSTPRPAPGPTTRLTRHDPLVGMNRQRVLAVVLLLLALLALAASRAFPFMDDLHEALKIAVTVAGVACALAGVALWLRGAPDSSR